MTAQITYWTLPVADVDRARAFFGLVLGWELSPPGGQGGAHVMGSEPWGGLAPGGPPPRTTAAFGVDDLDAVLARVREHGGTVSEPATGDEVYGTWVECTDDQGTPFAIFQRDSAAG